MSIFPRLGKYRKYRWVQGEKIMKTTEMTEMNRITTINSQPGPILALGYELHGKQAHLWKIDELTWVVTFMDGGNSKNCKAIACVGYEHASDILNRCIEEIMENPGGFIN